MRRVVVTGGSAITPIGGDWESVRASLVARRSGVVRMHEWDKYTHMNTRLAAPTAFTDPGYPRKKTRGMGKVALMAVKAAETAFADAGLLGDPVLRSGACGVSYGSSTGNVDALLDSCRKTGADAVLRVPVGTIVRDEETHLLIKDLSADQQSVIVAKGGRGGIGNEHNKTVKPPEKGEGRTIGLELKLVADVGIVGFPNAGKSTLICNISRVKSKIANYPFTTKRPVLGIVEDDDGQGFAVADLPGIIEGAHQGKGLGDRFLRHAERTKILVHLIDMAASEGRDPVEDYHKINHELESYGESLAFKRRIVVANKMDVPGAEEQLRRFCKETQVEVLAISALSGTRLDELVSRLRKIL